MSPAERQAALASITRWEARGRIALKSPGASGQGNFRWIQSDDVTVLKVAGPFGAGAYEIRWEPARITVLSGRGEVAADYAGPDAAARLLEQELGWAWPLANTRYWLRGLAVPPLSDPRAISRIMVSLTRTGGTPLRRAPSGQRARPPASVMTGPAGRYAGHRSMSSDWSLTA